MATKEPRPRTPGGQFGYGTLSPEARADAARRGWAARRARLAVTGHEPFPRELVVWVRPPGTTGGDR